MIILDELIKVITYTNSTDDDGFDVEVSHEKELFCEVKSASYLDSYNSMAQGTRASIEFEIRKEDFDELRITENEKHFYPSEVIYDGAKYNLIRWRIIDKAKASLICG